MFDCRDFFLARFSLRGDALPAAAAFDAVDDFVAVTRRDLRFGAIYARVSPTAFKVLVTLEYNTKGGEPANRWTQAGVHAT